MENEREQQLTEVILFGLALIALAEEFDLDLGNGWRDFKRKANNAGIEYQPKESE